VRAISSLVLAACAACGAAQQPLPAGQQRITDVEIKPVVPTKITASKGDLLGGLALERARRVGDPFDRYLLAIDEQRLRSWYVRNGYFRAQVQGDVKDHGRDAVDVAFRVDEGPRALLARVEITGLPDDPKVDAADLRKLIALDDGAPFDYATYDLAKPALTAALARDGYPRARVDLRVDADLDHNAAIIQVAFTPGPRCRFGAITIKGVDGPLAESVRARVAARPGDLYSSDDLADTRARLYDMQRFATVRIEPDLSGEGDVIPITVAVELSTRHELRLGGGFGMNPTSYEVHTRAGYTISGWPGDLETTRLALKPALVRLRETGLWEPRIEALAAIDRMDLFVPQLTGTAEVGLQWITVEAYTSDGPHVQLGLKMPLYRRYLQASTAWHLEALELRDVSTALTPELRAQLGLDAPSYRLGYLEETLIADLRDDPVEPRWGAYGEVRAHEGSRFAGGAFDYLRLVPELRGYVPVGPVVLASRARLGTLVGDVPVTERFYAGGANSQRGFGERTLSPFVTGMVNGAIIDVPYGGGALLELSEEARFPLGHLFGQRVGGVTFLDGGDDTEVLSQLDLGHLHWAAGAGLRVHTLIGPVRLDLAYRLDRYQPGEPAAGHRFAFHLCIGEAF
jgi:outer membrane translocation and assembly module TamA